MVDTYPIVPKPMVVLFKFAMDKPAPPACPLMVIWFPFELNVILVPGISVVEV